MNRPTLRDRLANFLLLCGILTGIALVVIVTTRLSAEALSLAVGVGIGVAAIAVPLAILAFVAQAVAKVLEARNRRPISRAPDAQTTPQILVVNPQQSPYALPPPQWSAGAWDAAPYPAERPERQFTVIGD